jgi:hypothetical protein
VLEVAFITDAPRVAGSEIWLLERLPRLASLGLQPTLFLPQRPNLDAFAEALEKKGVRVRRYARLGEVLEATAIARKGSSQVWLGLDLEVLYRTLPAKHARKLRGSPDDSSQCERRGS